MPINNTARQAWKRSENQIDFIERCRNESILDKRIPLGYSVLNLEIESGTHIRDYYKQKHARGERGQHYGLHIVNRDRA
jgi:hypothetical protein